VHDVCVLALAQPQARRAPGLPSARSVLVSQRIPSVSSPWPRAGPPSLRNVCCPYRPARDLSAGAARCRLWTRLIPVRLFRRMLLPSKGSRGAQFSTGDFCSTSAGVESHPSRLQLPPDGTPHLASQPNRSLAPASRLGGGQAPPQSRPGSSMTLVADNANELRSREIEEHRISRSPESPVLHPG